MASDLTPPLAGDGQLAPPAAKPESAETRWLAASEIRLREDARGQLVLTLDERETSPVTVGKLFALSEPARFVCFRDGEGNELGILIEPGELGEPSRSLLRRHLDRQYFIPIIQHVDKISEFFIDQTWTVQTDRGPRTFTIQGRDSIRFLSDRAMLLMDMDDNRYLLADRLALDDASRRWVDQFVW